MTNLARAPIPCSAEFETFASVPLSAVHVRFDLYNGTTLLASNVSSASSAMVEATLTVDLSGPGALWSIRTPALYRILATLLVDGSPVDALNVTTGFRSTRWSATTGFYLNEELVKFRGFSHHNSFTGVGVAMPARLDLFRAQAMRAVGGNFWRMSHNPYSVSTYDILDHLGVLVWDETRDFGMPYASNMHDMVKRDRNHASVIIWSLCNEYECNAPTVATGKAFIDSGKSVDTSRPFAANSNSQDNLYQVLDVQGWSHRNSTAMTAFHQQYPNIPEVLSECCSCTSQRLWFPRTTTECIPSQRPSASPHRTALAFFRM
jgi:beta-galactosidase/beta-glucuronidase